MPDIIWSDASRFDLRSIDSYLLPRNPPAAGHVLRQIRAAASLLERFPSVGASLDGNLRYLRVRNAPYVIVYLLSPDRVEIVRIRHVREDWLPRSAPE